MRRCAGHSVCTCFHGDMLAPRLSTGLLSSVFFPPIPVSTATTGPVILCQGGPSASLPGPMRRGSLFLRQPAVSPDSPGPQRFPRVESPRLFGFFWNSEPVAQVFLLLHGLSRAFSLPIFQSSVFPSLTFPNSLPFETSISLLPQPSLELLHHGPPSTHPQCHQIHQVDCAPARSSLGSLPRC